MEENVLNQEQTTALSENPAEEEEGFFDDYTEDDAIPASSEDDQTLDSEDSEPDEGTQGSEETQENAQNTPFLTVKFNKESRGLSQEEAIEYAQKGLNYDKIYEGYTSLKEGEPLLAELRRLATINNMSPDDYLANLANVQNEIAIDQEVETLKAKYPNSDENALRELAEKTVNERHAAVSNNELKKQQQEADLRKQEIGRQLDIFHQRYPDVDPQKLDQKVYELMQNGYTLTEAYDANEADKRAAVEKEKISQEKISKKNEENKKKNMGNMTNVGSNEYDAFLDGYNS